MIVHFWGVRGSLATPITPQQIQSKIMAVVQRITPKDIESEDARSKFVSSLPSWIFGTTGGNTPCVELKINNQEFVLDAGTGIRVLGKSNNRPADKHYNLFFSHFHWDHIQGLPFFDPAYDPTASFDVYSCCDFAKEALVKQMEQPYYPVNFNAFTKNFTFHTIEPEKPFEIEGIKINSAEMFHPGKSHSFSFEYEGKKFVYATDVELKSKDYSMSPEKAAVFKDADCIVLDAQYTVEEAFRKENWGHSAFCYAIDFAVYWNIKKVYLFHHEPTYDDKKMNSILQAARWYAQYIEHSNVEICLAKEGLEIEI